MRKLVGDSKFEGRMPSLRKMVDYLLIEGILPSGAGLSRPAMRRLLQPASDTMEAVGT